ncbi:MAG: DUF484 family protein [Alphaproteobacteria bacterium]
MGSVIDFEVGAMASLKRRVAEVEEANQDLIAFARGHSGAVSSIHSALLAATEAESLDHLIHIVTQMWPDILGLDAVSMALFVDEGGLRADASGVQFVERRLIERSIEGVDAVVMRGVDRGHPLFGPASELIRAEALIRLPVDGPLPGGILMLGQRRPMGFDNWAGSELLTFLGAMLSRLVLRWLLP